MDKPTILFKVYYNLISMKKYIFLLWFCVLGNYSIAQLESQTQIKEGLTQNWTEGIFQYSVNSVGYKIQISLSGNFYKEFNSSDELLSQGEFIKLGDNLFQLTPDQIESNALVFSPLNFSYGDISNEIIQIFIHTQEETIQTLDITRVN